MKDKRTTALSNQAKMVEKFGLTAMESRFVWYKHQAVKKGRDNPSGGDLWEIAGGRAKSQSAKESAASKTLKKPKVAEALDWLRRRREAKEVSGRKAQIRRLEGHATADISSYVAVSHSFLSRKELRDLLDSIEDDELLFREIRNRLSSVALTDWSKLSKEQLRSVVSVEESSDGRVKFRLESKAWTERLLQEAHGWSKRDEILEGMKDILSGMAGEPEEMKAWFIAYLGRHAENL